MKYTMDGTMAQVLRRRDMIYARRHRRESLGLTGGTMLTLLMLLLSFIGLMRESGTQQKPEMGVYGASMIPAEMGGYVLVGVASFCVAVVVTVLCIRWRDKNGK